MSLKHLTPAVNDLVTFCKQYEGYTIQKIKINSYFTINDVNKFLSTSFIVLDCYPEKHRNAQNAITRLVMFKNYILTQSKKKT